jgi:hypothetical protein
MSMDKSVAQVLKGFLNLSEAQRREFIELVNKFQSGTTYSNEQLRESVNASVTKMQTGPYRDTCGCCGR